MAHCLPSKRAHAKRIDAAVKFGWLRASGTMLPERGGAGCNDDIWTRVLVLGFNVYIMGFKV